MRVTTTGWSRWITAVIGSVLLYGAAFGFFLIVFVQVVIYFSDDEVYAPIEVNVGALLAILLFTLCVAAFGFVIRKGYRWAHRLLEYGLLVIAIFLCVWPFYSCYSDPWTCHYRTMFWQLYPGMIVLLLANALRNTRLVLSSRKPKSHRLFVALVLVCVVAIAPPYLQRWFFKMECNRHIVGWDDDHHYQYVGDERVNTYLQHLKVAAQIIELEQHPYSGPLNILNGEYAAYLVPPGGVDSVLIGLDEENRSFSFAMGSDKENTSLTITRSEYLEAPLAGYDHSIESLDCSAGTAAMAKMSEDIVSRTYLMVSAAKAWRTADRKFWVFGHGSGNTKRETRSFSIVRNASGSSFFEIRYYVPPALSGDLFNAIVRKPVLPGENFPSWLSRLERSIVDGEPVDMATLQTELNSHDFSLRDDSSGSNIYAFIKNGIETQP